MIMEILGVTVPITYAPARVGDVKDSLADISKAERLLGYKPAVHFREGLERAITWYKNKEN
jgi:nucleoside-diphosphate-sugar epimerase